MIRKIMNRINEWLEDGLRGLLGRLTPDRRIILVITMFLVFGGLSIYMTFFSIYNFGRDKGKKMQIEQIKTLKLQLEQQRDSINNQNNLYNGTGEFE
ncbi:TraL conjugative transposon family protein [Bacteroides thetaiotaomicron]|uniref:TraL conjugative transposon family protein n=1 Tax=Bacteroides thetaiotaomicron TaxID=818 RepID=UPI0034AFC380